MSPHDWKSDTLVFGFLILCAGNHVFQPVVSSPSPSDIAYENSYTNDFAVEIDGDSSVADLIAGVYGFTLVRQVSDQDNLYHFVHESVSRRSRRGAEDLVGTLNNDPNVKWAEQQKLLHRRKRGTYNHADNHPVNTRNHGESDANLQAERDAILEGRTSGADSVRFNDPHFSDQWYLINRGQTGGVVGYDLNVLPVWRMGITGKGVVVSILDDGIQHSHPDLIGNYDAKASTDLNDRADKERDPTPNLSDPSNNHGTRCAGEVAASANNSNCCVGIAFNARIGGVRMLDGPVTDLLEAEAISFNSRYIDIYSASWGPPDDGKTMEAPHRYCSRAFEQGVKKGRGGLGSIYVWATGNGGTVGDACSCDGYVSSIYTLSIGSISERGLSTYFSEVCPSTMAVVFAGGSHLMPGDVNYSAPTIKVVTTDVDGKCTTEFQGTSSAAPLAAGCVALVLEANPKLTWRDVQNIVVHTAKIPNDEEDGWIVNGGGFHVNHRFGFGVLDCAKMVEAAQSWTTVPEQHQCEVKSNNEPLIIYSRATAEQSLTTDGCHGTASSIDHLEHVQVHVRIEHERRGDISMILTSPAGTQSNILTRRPLDAFAKPFNFTFMSVHCWGESAAGEWKLSVSDNQVSKRQQGTSEDGGSGRQRGRLIEWSMTLFGISGKVNNPTHTEDASNINELTSDGKDSTGEGKSRKVDKSEVESLMEKEVRSSETVQIKNGNENSETASSAEHAIQSPKVEEQQTRTDKNENEKLTNKDFDFLRRLYEIERQSSRTHGKHDESSEVGKRSFENGGNGGIQGGRMEGGYPGERESDDGSIRREYEGQENAMQDEEEQLLWKILKILYD